VPNQSPAGAVSASSSAPVPPYISLITSPQASKQLSLDLSSTITEVPESPHNQPDTASEIILSQRSGHRRNISTTSMPARTRSGTLSSLASWIPWNRPDSDDATKAETKLREMLTLSQGPSLAKGKTALRVV
jgi:hypothetical protein